MKKTLTHNGKTFELRLTLNHNAERRMGGKVEHLLSTMGLEEDNKWNRSYNIDADKMKEQIEAAEQEIMEFADGKKLSEAEEIAASLGFM